MSDSLSQSECYRALAEEYRRRAATSSSTENRDRYLRMARIARIRAGWPSPKNQADQPTTKAMATENANNARPARTSTQTSRFPKPWRIVEIPNGFAVNDATGRQLGVFYGRTDPNTAGHTDFVMIDEARQIAIDFARQLEPLKQTSDRSKVATSPEDDKRAKLQTSRSPQRAPETSRLPRAAQLPAATDLPLVSEATTVPHSIWSEPDECWSEPDEWRSAPLLRRASEPPHNWTKYLIAIAVAALPAGYFIFRNSDRPVDVAVAPQATTNVPAVEFLPSRKADAPLANATNVTVESRAEPEIRTESLQAAGHLDIKPIESGIERKAESPSANATDVAVESRARPEVRTEPLQAAGHLDIKPTESGIARKADAPSANATDVTAETRVEPEVRMKSLQSAGRLDIKPTESGIEAKPPEAFAERGRWSFAASRDASTCFDSASAVRQNSPGAWPSWTLRALGHEGTRCWYAATQFTARHRRSEMRRKETVQTTEKPEFPGGLFGLQ